MGKRGPKPVPSAILRLRGTWRLGDDEPVPPVGPPKKPDWLRDGASLLWDALVPDLVIMRVMSRIDAHAFARYCKLTMRWLEASEFIDRHGTTYPLKDGTGKVKCLVPFPQVGIESRLSTELSRMESEFGLTPSARTRLRVSATPVDEAMPGIIAPRPNYARFDRRDVDDP